MADSIVEMAVNLTEQERKEADRLYPGPTEFVHLHNHTLFSQLDGIATPEEYFSASAYLGHPAFSITDHGSMAAIPDAYWSAKKHKVKFIPGCEIYFAQNHLKLLELKEDPTFKINSMKSDYSKSVFNYDDLVADEEFADLKTNRHLTTMAMNELGYRNLIHMTSQAWEIGFYYKPRIWFEQIEKYHEGLIILSGCLNGPVCHALRKAAQWNGIAKGTITKVERPLNGTKKMIDLDVPADLAKARFNHYQDIAIDWIRKFRRLMGDRFYLEAQMPGDDIPFGKEAFKMIVALSKAMKIPAVISNDCHYLKREDFKVQKCMMAIDQGKTINDPSIFHVDSDEQFFKSRAQLRRTFFESGYDQYATIDEFEQMCDNTVNLASRCNTFSPNLDPKLPKIPNADEELRNLVYEALQKRGLWDNQTQHKIDGEMITYRSLAEKELNRYISKGFASYFLIIRDLVKFSKDKGWPVGPSRGSVGGSLVSYLIGIHELDPIAWGLSSVRFMGDSRGGHMLKVTMD